ncbi:MAG: hypothetical protein HOU81_17845 [Hamadaea sp.]|uniref:hypothetical protein n=1 Tax=Hamadaea sp. TaxID=2024425 RepID=UPI0018177B65|nr:hypothetical protein [Hamadaea sp.]NUR72682.1 hypothetical protein [Hamadaea sp.]NUT21881.1 hypothetical protein [Hamadaea sp.]
MNLDIAHYAAAVGAALADLPDDIRAELLEDLPAHLAEVAAEVEAEGGTLEARLGTPAAYAAELRATLGASVPAGGGARLSTLVVQAKGRLRTTDRQIGRIIGYAGLSEFGRLLRPGWWVVRGYLAAWILCEVVSGGSGPEGALPRIGDSVVGGLIVALAMIVASVWLGRTAATRVKRWQRVGSGVVSAGLVLFGIGLLVNVDDQATREYGGGYYGEYPGQWVDASWQGGGNLVVVDAKGQVLSQVSVINLDSESYVDAKIHNCDAILTWEYERWPVLARLCRHQGLYPGDSPTGGPTAAPTVAPTTTPSVTPTTAPTR